MTDDTGTRRQRPKILVVDDTHANLVAMRRLLWKVEVEIIEAVFGNDALAACIDHDFALILLDVNMPDMSGFEVAELLTGDERTREVPIIFLTAAYSDDLNRLKGYRLGATDYIAKPVNDVILRAKVQIFLDLYRSRMQMKEAFEQLSALNEKLRREVADRERAEADARHQATHDHLTGLPNRSLVMDRLEGAIVRARSDGRLFALAFIDIDGFKPVNDQYGHQAGDDLLKCIAARLREHVRGGDTVARLGGDEFMVIMEDAAETQSVALCLGETLCNQLREPYRIEASGKQVIVEISASVGVALFPLHGQDCDALVRASDQAMYASKRSGKNCCSLAASGESPVDRRVLSERRG